jgi:excisionase family DNA binding protein
VDLKNDMQLMPVRKAAEILDVAEVTVWNYVYSRQLESVKVGRLRRISVRAIREFQQRGLSPAA